MIDGKTVLAVIPARGGSKGVPRKNLRLVDGRPLIAWTIEEAKKSRYIDRLILSSEDDEIILVAKEWGCEVPFVRPAELAGDETPGIAPVLHAIEQLPDYDYVVLLQPTSPLRTVKDIDGCIETCLRCSAPACVSVTRADKSPLWMYSLGPDGKMQPAMKGDHAAMRQQSPKFFVLNGAVYVSEIKKLKEIQGFVAKETVAYIMEKHRSLDIDEECDFYYLEFMISQANIGK